MAVMLYHTELTLGGSVGVDVFFVLSGWLITGLLAREADVTGSIDRWAFWLRRLRRLAPALLFLLLVVATVNLIYGRPPVSNAMAFAASYTMDFRQALWPDTDPLSHTWSLAIEEQFYLVWPFVVMAAVSAGRERAAAWMAAGWAALNLVRVAMFAKGAYALPYFSPLHSSGLLLGAAMAMRPVKVPSWAGWLGLALIFVTFLVRAGPVSVGHGHPEAAAWEIPLAEIGAALVIASPPAFLAGRPLVALGLVSYGVYLWHIPLWRVLMRYPGGAWLTIAASIGVAAFSYRYVERPFRAPRKAVQGGGFNGSPQ
jgi:peptidoglycan/LPS O-acetylase OafA/YrhL